MPFASSESRRENLLAESIIENHFLDFAEKRWKDLSKKIGVTLKEIQEVFDYVQTLNPRQHHSFSGKTFLYSAGCGRGSSGWHAACREL